MKHVILICFAVLLSCKGHRSNIRTPNTHTMSCIRRVIQYDEQDGSQTIRRMEVAKKLLGRRMVDSLEKIEGLRNRLACIRTSIHHQGLQLYRHQTGSWVLTPDNHRANQKSA